MGKGKRSGLQYRALPPNGAPRSLTCTQLPRAPVVAQKCLQTLKRHVSEVSRSDLGDERHCRQPKVLCACPPVSRSPQRSGAQLRVYRPLLRHHLAIAGYLKPSQASHRPSIAPWPGADFPAGFVSTQPLLPLVRAFSTQHRMRLRTAAPRSGHQDACVESLLPGSPPQMPIQSAELGAMLFTTVKRSDAHLS